jgi:hypothetical protein
LCVGISRRSPPLCVNKIKARYDIAITVVHLLSLKNVTTILDLLTRQAKNPKSTVVSGFRERHLHPEIQGH